MRKGLIAVLMALAVVLACGPALADDTIKIGVMEPLSGTFKDIGERYLAGVEYAAEVLNKKGGLLGKKLEVVPVDSELKPAIATRKATKLILKDGVKHFCGGTGSSVAGAMVQLAAQHDLVFYTYGMAAASLTGPKCDSHFFRACLNTDQQSAALAYWVAEKGFKKIFCIGQDYSFGQEAVAGFIKKLKELNPKAEIVGTKFHPIGTKDFAPYVSEIIASEADLVFTSNWGSDLTLLLKQAKPLGLKAKFACYYINDENAIQSVGNDEAVIGSYGAESYMLSIPNKANAEFVQGFKDSKGYYPSWLRGKAYAATMFWAAAVQKAGTDEPNKVAKAWEGLDYDGIAGKWHMQAANHQTLMPAWVAEVVPTSTFYDHAYMGEPTMIPGKDITKPVKDTGCPGLAK